MSETNMTTIDVAFRKLVVDAGAEENLLDVDNIEGDKRVEETEEYEIDVEPEEVAIIKEVMAANPKGFVVHQDQGTEDRSGFTGGPASFDSFQPGEFSAEVEFDELVEVDFTKSKLDEENLTFTFTITTYADYRYYR